MELRDVAGFPGYSVTDDGRIWSEKSQKWLKGVPTKVGYLIVTLYVEGKKHMKTIHRLVAEAFIPNPEGLPEVNHRDEDKANNVVSNLEWCSTKYNCNYGTRNERVLAKCHTPEARAKDRATKQRIYGKPVVQLTLDGKEVARFRCANEAARQTGFAQGSISKVCRGERRMCGSYRWEYLPKEA